MILKLMSLNKARLKEWCTKKIVNMKQTSTTTNKVASIDNGGNKIEVCPWK